MRSIRVVIGVLLFAATATAQTPQLTWNAPNNVSTAAEATALIYTLYVNNGAGVLVTGATCTGSTAPYACVAPVPSGTPTAIGTKLELTAKTSTSEESPRSLPFISPPTAPTNLRRQ